MVALVLQLIAGASFADDFESGVLLKPTGAWSTVNGVNLNLTAGIADAGPHRGALALRLTDNETQSGVGSQVSVSGDATGLTTAMHLRAWVRQVMAGDGNVFLFNEDMASGRATSEVVFETLTGRLHLTGYQADGGYGGALADAGLPPGEWHLLEVASTGLGTRQGARQLWLDGRLVAQAAADFQGATPGHFTVGEYWAESRTTTGTLDYDDVRVSSAPNATWVGVRGPSSATAGDCVPFTAELTDVLGAAAPAPYDVDVALMGMGRFSLASDCAGTVSSVTISTGSTTASFWFEPAAVGGAVLRGQHADFLSGGNWAIAVAPVDAGVPDAGPADAGASTDGGPDTDAGMTSDAGASLALELVLSETQLAAGASSLMRVRLVDAAKAPVTKPAAYDVTLHTTSSRGGFALKGSDPVAQTFTLSVPAGASEAGCYYRDFSEGVATLTAATPQAAGATALIEIQPAPAQGCGCGGGGEVPLVLLLIAAARARRSCRRAAGSRR